MSLNNKVKPGQPFEVKAATWNDFIDAADYVKNTRNSGGNPVRGTLPEGWIYFKNGSKTLMPHFSAILLTDLIAGSENGSLEKEPSIPVFVAANYHEQLKMYPVAVTQEPVLPDGVGRAMLNGVSPIRLNLIAPTHTFAVPAADGVWTSADAGLARLLWKSGNSATGWAFAHFGGTGGAALESYSGYFLVIDVSEKDEAGEVISWKVRVIDGARNIAERLGDHIAGFLITSKNNPVNAETLVVAPDAAWYLILETTWSIETQEYRFAFKLLDDYPREQEESIDRKQLARISFRDGKMSISQIWKNGIIDLMETRWV